MRHLILGNGPAGVIAAETIRRYAPEDEIVVVGAERGAPYSRMAIPYLLMGQIEECGTLLRKTAGQGVILSMGGGVSPGMPVENIRALTEA